MSSNLILLKIDQQIQSLKNEILTDEKKEITTQTNLSSDQFETLKKKLLEKNPSLRFNEDVDLCLIYYDRNYENKLNDVEEQCRSYVIDKKTCERVFNQFDRILQNEEALKYLEDHKVSWDNITVQPSYEGTLIILGYYEGKWRRMTRGRLDAYESTWIPNMSHGLMFDQAVGKKFDFEKDLNRDYFYYLVLIHADNHHIVSYESLFGENYRELIHIATKEKNSLREIKDNKITNITRPLNCTFKNLEEINASLNEKNKLMETNKIIDFEGYVLKVYDNAEKNGHYKVLKLQSERYIKLKEMRPNYGNIYQVCLELFQKNKLPEFLTYYPYLRNMHVTNKIANAMKTLAQEILILYHSTRNKNNARLYSELGSNFKTVLFMLHGKYITKRQAEFKAKSKTSEKDEVKSSPLDMEMKADQKPTSITIHDVYYTLKETTTKSLTYLFWERNELLENCKERHPINGRCYYARSLTKALWQ